MLKVKVYLYSNTLYHLNSSEKYHQSIFGDLEFVHNGFGNQNLQAYSSLGLHKA